MIERKEEKIVMVDFMDAVNRATGCDEHTMIFIEEIKSILINIMKYLVDNGDCYIKVCDLLNIDKSYSVVKQELKVIKTLIEYEYICICNDGLSFSIEKVSQFFVINPVLDPKTDIYIVE